MGRYAPDLLIVAATRGAVDLVRCVLRRCAAQLDLNRVDASGKTALMWAAFKGQFHDTSGKTALMWAAFKGHFCDASGKTALMWAAFKGQFHDASGKTALMWAAFKGQFHDTSGKTALMWVAFKCQFDDASGQAASSGCQFPFGKKFLQGGRVICTWGHSTVNITRQEENGTQIRTFLED